MPARPLCRCNEARQPVLVQPLTQDIHDFEHGLDIALDVEIIPQKQLGQCLVAARLEEGAEAPVVFQHNRRAPRRVIGPLAAARKLERDMLQRASEALAQTLALS